jgi:hypothetical protein
MKIQLERTLASCPKKLLCTVCGQAFGVNKIRALLYNDKGLLQGDVCSRCVRHKPTRIRSHLRDRASLLLQQPVISEAQTLDTHDRALELLETAQESVQFPQFYHWWMKQWEVFSEESQETESERLGLRDFYGEERERLQKMLEDDRE